MRLLTAFARLAKHAMLAPEGFATWAVGKWPDAVVVLARHRAYVAAKRLVHGGS